MTITKTYMQAFKSLYGNDSEPVQYRKDPGKRNYRERKEQIKVATWLRKNNIPFYHPANGGKRNRFEAMNFKRMGVSPGAPDICIPRARKGYHGLYIEIKPVEGGKLSNYQMYWRDLLIGEGYAWFEARGAQKCIEIIETYLRE